MPRSSENAIGVSVALGGQSDNVSGGFSNAIEEVRTSVLFSPSPSLVTERSCEGQQKHCVEYPHSLIKYLHFFHSRQVLRTRWPGCRIDWMGQSIPNID